MRHALTEISVRALKGSDDYKTYWDSTPGFGVRVGKRSKTYIVMRGRSRERVSIGKVGEITLTDARLEAKRLLATTPEAKGPARTFKAAREEFLDQHYKAKGTYTKYQVQRVLEKHFKSLEPMVLADITDTIIKRSLDKLSDRPSAQLHAYRYMRTFLTWATPRFKARSPRGMIFTSNHREAIPLEKGDRRFAVIQTNERRENDAYFAQLAEAIPRESAAFAFWLDHRDLSAFDPYAPAPDTALKMDMQRLSLSPLELAITEAMEDGDGVFADDVGTAEQVTEVITLRNWNRPRPTPTSVAQALNKVGARSLGERRLRDKGKVRLWAFRDTERWVDADIDALYKAYRPRHPFAPTGNVVALRQDAA